MVLLLVFLSGLVFMFNPTLFGGAFIIGAIMVGLSLLPLLVILVGLVALWIDSKPRKRRH